VAARDLERDALGGALDAVEVGDGGAAELHHEDGHGGCPWIPGDL
jgi:hypothetical protein